ncbi:hypothetical protein [Methylocystis echinoides]|jgi:hypothetical protein|uniref:hypothetical protein n=1 Tax=Methylocystis echinoides TaxID=29468 RepID=UPI00341982D9
MGKLFLVVSTVVGLAAITPAIAQGTAKQRAACERDSHRLCAAAEPDAIAVEKCLKQHMGALSKACQRQFRARR